jgi:hypothetical protein
MKHQRHFDPITPRFRQVPTILGMIDDLERIARLLDCDIAVQKEHQAIASPLLASLTSRRDKLQETIAMLKSQLVDIRGSQG